MVKIRAATYTDDIEYFARIGERDHVRSRYKDIPYCVGSVMRLLVTMIDQGLLFIAEDEVTVVGGIGGLVSPIHFNDAVLTGCMRFWWVDLPYQKTRVSMRLLDRIELAAATRGCKYWFLSSVIVDRERDLGRLFKLRGYTLVEHEHMKALT